MKSRRSTNTGNTGSEEEIVKQFATAFFLLFPISIFVAGQNAATSPSTSLAYVLDPAGQTVTAMDLVSGEKTATALVSGQATDVDLISDERTPIGAVSDPYHSGVDTLLPTPDGSRLVRLRTGNHKETARYGFHPLEKSTATIVDTRTMQVVAQADLGWGLSDYYLTPDKKVLVTIASGYQSQKPEETLPSEIITTNLSSGQVLGRLSLPRPPSACLLSKDGATAMLLYTRQSQKGAPSIPAELQFVSIEKQSVVGKITLDGAPDKPVLAPAGDYIYLIEKGEPSNNPGKNINGRIQVVSLKEMKVAAVLDAGSDPKGVLADEAAGQTLILSNGAPVKGQKEVDGELRVIRGAAIASLLRVGAAPRFVRFSPDRKRLYVICWDGLTAIDYTSLGELGRIPLGGTASELAFAPDGNLGFALFPESNRLSFLDLQALKPGASVTTGRGSIKFAKTLGAIAATGVSAAAASGQAYNMARMDGGFGMASYQVFTIAPANTSIAVRPDGAFVYVLNSQTNDVTIVNTSTSLVVDKIAAGGQRLEPLKGGGVLAIVAKNSLHLIDTASQKALPDVQFDKNLLEVRLSPDGRTGLALVEGSVVLLNGSTGEIRGRIDGFKRPRTVLFAQEELAPSASTQP